MNLGAILRTSYYFGVDEIFTPKEKRLDLIWIVMVISIPRIESLTIYLV